MGRQSGDAELKAERRKSQSGTETAAEAEDVIVLLELLPLMFYENLHIMIRADRKLKQKE